MYADALQYLASVKEKIHAQDPFDLEPASHIVERIVDEPGMIEHMFPLSMKTPQGEDFLLPHQVNDMIYTLKLGIALHYSRPQLIELGLSALLHDVGMFLLPQDIVNKEEELTPAETDLMRSHVGYGRNILSRFEERHAYLPQVAHQHHERDDGSGYPGGLRGAAIHEYAKILCLMDCYEAMTHDRPTRKALNQTFSARELMVEIKGTGFPPHIVKAFLEEITLYPVGSYVRLNNKSIGTVVATSSAHPLRPEVRIIFDHQGNRVKGEQIIKLQETSLIFIQECLSAAGLPEYSG